MDFLNMKKAYIVKAKRTAIGKYGGSLASIPITDVMGELVTNILKSYLQINDRIDEVIIGNVLSAGLGQNPARIAAIRGQISHNVPAYTVNKVCGSGLKSIILAAQSIVCGDAQLILAGGMESMSRAPYYLNNYRFGVKFGHQNIDDGMILDGLYCSLIGEHMGITAENIAKKYNISRKQQDEFSYLSHIKAIKAIKNNYFDTQIVPIKISNKDKDCIFKTDEQPRPDTSIEKLSQLRSVFKKDGSVTAGNSSSINDGAAVALIASEDAVKKYKLKSKTVILSYAYVGLNPSYMGMGGYYAAIKCLANAGKKASQIDLWEINEAFASQSVAVISRLGIDQKKVNITGGAIAFGHPIGASGARILTTLVYNLERVNKRYGLATLCIGGGQGIALLVENIN
jgi:acetyl-CoA C-acetyltransferase